MPKCLPRHHSRSRDDSRQQLPRLRERQTHDPGVAAFEPRDEGGGEALDGVGPGLAEGFAYVAVLFAFPLFDHPEGDAVAIYPRVFVRTNDHGDRGVDLMRPSGQHPEHGDGVITIARLAQDAAIDHDLGIRTED
jgi:hypothetical protein